MESKKIKCDFCGESFLDADLLRTRENKEICENCITKLELLECLHCNTYNDFDEMVSDEICIECYTNLFEFINLYWRKNHEI